LFLFFFFQVACTLPSPLSTPGPSFLFHIFLLLFYLPSERAGFRSDSDYCVFRSGSFIFVCARDGPTVAYLFFRTLLSHGLTFFTRLRKRRRPPSRGAQNLCREAALLGIIHSLPQEPGLFFTRIHPPGFSQTCDWQRVNTAGYVFKEQPFIPLNPLLARSSVADSIRSSYTSVLPLRDIFPVPRLKGRS